MLWRSQLAESILSLLEYWQSRATKPCLWHICHETWCWMRGNSIICLFTVLLRLLPFGFPMTRIRRSTAHLDPAARRNPVLFFFQHRQHSQLCPNMHWLSDPRAAVVDPVWVRLNASLLTLIDLVERRVLQHEPAAKFGYPCLVGSVLVRKSTPNSHDRYRSVFSRNFNLPDVPRYSTSKIYNLFLFAT